MKLTRRNLLFGLGAAAAAPVLAPAEPLLVSAAARAAASRSTTPAGLILLSRNENPYGPFPTTQQAMRDALNRANRYTFPPDYSALVDRITNLHGVDRQSVIVGAGSTELLRMAADAFTGPGKRLITGDPTFEAMGSYASNRGTQVIRIPLTSTYAHDLEGMLRAAREGPNGGLFYICNPNNPTGTITPSPELSEFVRQIPAGYILLLDEAYHHFAEGVAGYASTQPAANVIVTRTFSKVYGMAGIRLGYGISAPQTIQKLRPWQLDNNVNTVAAQCGAVALEDAASTRAAAKRIVADRESFMKQAAARNVKVIPSFTNFAMMHTGRPAQQVIDYFRSRNIQIGRPFPPMLDHVRVSFGTPEEMRQFWQAWDAMATNHA
jgi:histidinol-phosphate aminotransferase